MLLLSVPLRLVDSPHVSIHVGWSYEWSYCIYKHDHSIKSCWSGCILLVKFRPEPQAHFAIALKVTKQIDQAGHGCVYVAREQREQFLTRLREPRSSDFWTNYNYFLCWQLASVTHRAVLVLCLVSARASENIFVCTYSTGMNKCSSNLHNQRYPAISQLRGDIMITVICESRGRGFPVAFFCNIFCMELETVSGIPVMCLNRLSLLIPIPHCFL